MIIKKKKFLHPLWVDQEKYLEDELESDEQSIKIRIDLVFCIDNEDYDPYLEILEDQFEKTRVLCMHFPRFYLCLVCVS
jgi:hypothetical protein